MHLCFEWTTAARIENHWRTQRVRILSVSVVFWRIVSNVMQSIYSFFSLFAQYIPQYSGKMLNKVGFITWRGDRYVSNHWVFLFFRIDENGIVFEVEVSREEALATLELYKRTCPGLSSLSSLQGILQSMDRVGVSTHTHTNKLTVIYDICFFFYLSFKSN